MKFQITSFFLSFLTVVVTNTSLAQSPNCDDVAGAQLAVGTSCTPVTFNSNANSDYWNSAGIWGFCGETDVDDYWMWFDATSTSTTVTYTPSNGDAILTIFNGPCSPTMSSNIACSDNIGTVAETITFATVPGTRYRIRIQNYFSNTTMNGTICAYSVGGGTTTASDCSAAVNVCTDLSFSIDPNGFGTINEIPVSGSFGNPNINPASSNFGCLQVGEYNSTWMIVNIATSGNLEFVFGGLGAQAGYYDWIMYPYSGVATCAAIQANTLAPVRCNWNWVNFGGTGISDVVPAGGDPGNYEPPLAVTAGQRYIICFSNYSNALTTVPLQFLTDPGDATVSCTPLGFSMEGLSVECTEDHRVIQWSSPVQNTSAQFIVEKSRNNAEWETVGTAFNGEISDGRIRFSIVDPTNPDVLEYYRVKQVLISGEMLLSSTISADCDFEQELFSVYPNPSTGLMNLQYKSASDAVLQIHDVFGKLVYEQALESSQKMKTVQITAEQVPAGAYSYRIVMENEVKSGTVVIVK
ncbi:MAG: T9SS type A sorting domain-containing protein [Fluviicola sp.]|nr:T9SS type A sorting domain-containing protein [Fluviicola sp.]